MMDSQTQVVELATFVDRHSTIDDFARDIECSPSHLRNLIAGRKRPSIDLLARIAHRTKGRVNLKAFMTEAAE